MAEGSHQDTLRRRFAKFATSIEDLPLYRAIALGCAGDPEVAGLLGAARAGQDRPVLLLAAVHDLVLRRPELPLGRWYRSVTRVEDLARGDPWPTFRATCLDHADELRDVIATHATQTNEVNRVVLLAPLLAAACADDSDQPIALVELGCSAGLLLGLERYRIDVGGTVVGDADSHVRLSGELRGPRVPALTPFPPTPPIIDRVGIDLAPVHLGDDDQARWLEACLWPDQPERIERYRAAVAAQRLHPVRLVTGDFIDRLPEVAASVPEDAHFIVFHCWALTYVLRDRRPDLATRLSEIAAGGRNISWLSAEPPGCVPDIRVQDWSAEGEETMPDTVLGMRRWRRGTELDSVTAGWAQPHGAWLEWHA